MEEFIRQIITYFGIFGVAAIVFIESGLLVGAFLPGDSLLFTAGLFAATGFFDIRILIVATFFAAILGDNVGYLVGKYLGPKIYQKKDSRFFSQKNVELTKKYFDKYDKKAIVIARFIPIVRTFAPVMAGVFGMKKKTFYFYNFVGALFWAIGLPMLGYYLGNIEIVKRNYEVIVVLIVLLSVLPVVVEVVKNLFEKK